MAKTLEPLHAQGTLCKWGTTEFFVTSLSLSNNSGQDIDITSMSSAIYEDPDNTDRKFVAQDFDCCFSSQGGGEISIEFFGDSSIGDPVACVGYRRPIELKAGRDDTTSQTTTGKFEWKSTAILTQIQCQLSTGEFIKGSATFKLCG